MNYLNAFWVGGAICAICQIFIDRTKLTPARILVSLVVLGVFLQAVGVYQPLVDFAGAGATVPLLGFGYSLAKGVAKAVAESGLIGVFTGGVTGAAGGIAAADLSGPLLRAALAEKPDLIKPNRSEMCELMGQPGASDEAIRAYAVRLVADGIPYVLVSLGGDGALLACRDGVWRCKAPDVPVKSTLGCGDTMVASLLLSLLEQAAPAEMLRRAVALSSANAMTFETAHIQPETYRELLPLCTADRLI